MLSSSAAVAFLRSFRPGSALKRREEFLTCFCLFAASTHNLFRRERARRINGGKPRRLKKCLSIRILRRRQTLANACAYQDLWSIFGRNRFMAGTVKHAKLESRTARSRLKRGRQPHWQALVPGKVHLGYQCWKGDAVGRWVLRRYIGDSKYSRGSQRNLLRALDGLPMCTRCRKDAQVALRVVDNSDGSHAVWYGDGGSIS